MNLWKLKHNHAFIVEGNVKVGRSTKQLLRKLARKQIAVIDHRDLDEMAATGLIEAKVKAVINAAATMSGSYPTKGPLLLLRAGIPIYEIDAEHFTLFQDNAGVVIDDRFILLHGRRIPYTPFTEKDWSERNEQAYGNLDAQLNDFIDNTLYYAGKEKHFVIQPLSIPPLKTPIVGRHVVVVVRGSGYKHDLLAIQDYIEDYRPVLIGVDGGADALLECGCTPHIIIGDMDSISDDALKSGAEIIVHAYPDGSAPGMARIRAIGLDAKTLPAPGTSEDVAMLLAYEQGAELIVSLGTHTHMIDFLEKGRKGMASTVLVRMKIGSKLIDAKGVSKLYHRPLKLRNLWVVPLAGLFPLAMLSFIHPGVRQVFDMVWAYVKLSIS